MSRDHPILLTTSPEAAASLRRSTVFRSHPPPVGRSSPVHPIVASLRNETEVIDLVQDDDSEVIEMDDSEDEEGPIGFVGVNESSACHHSNDTYANCGLRGLRSRPVATKRVLAASNSVNQLSMIFDRRAPRNRSPKRMNVESVRLSTIRTSSLNHSSEEYTIDSSFTADHARRRRFQYNAPMAQEQTTTSFQASAFASRPRSRSDTSTSTPETRHHVTAHMRHPLSSMAARDSFETISAAAGRSTSSTQRFQSSVVFHDGGHRHTRSATHPTPPVLPSWRPPPIWHDDFSLGDFRTDEFESLPPEPEPALEDLRSIASLSRGTPAPEHIVSQLPVVAVEVDERPGPARNKEDLSCAICWEDYCRGEHRKLLPCLHSFHDVCLDQWLAINGSCPICKHKIQ